MADEPSFFASLDEEEAADMIAHGRPRTYARGATLFGECDVSGHVVLLRRGRVKVFYLTRDGREAVLAIREPGDVLGELSAIDGQPRSASAAAIDEVEAVVVPPEEFTAFLLRHPRAALTLARMISQRLRDADRKRVEFGSFDTTGRVARRLLEMASRFGETSGEGARLRLPLTQEELAAWVGVSRKAVTNALHELRERGLVETGRKTVVIRDLAALRHHAR